MANFRINPVKDRHPGFIMMVDFMNTQQMKDTLKLYFDQGWGEGLEELNAVKKEEADIIVSRADATTYKLRAGNTGLFRGEVEARWRPKDLPNEVVVEIVAMAGHTPLCLEELLWAYNAVVIDGHSLTAGAVKDFDYVEDKAVITLSKHHPCFEEDTQLAIKLVNLCD